MQHQVNDLLDDPGFNDQRELNLADMAGDDPQRWPGLKAVLASPNCPVKTLVLPSPRCPTMLHAFRMKDWDIAHNVSKYLASILGSVNQTSSNPGKLEVVRLQGWCLDDLRQLSKDEVLVGYPVVKYVVSGPTAVDTRHLLDLCSKQARVHLDDSILMKFAPEDLERYRLLWWYRLIGPGIDAPPAVLKTWTEFQGRRLDFGVNEHQHCGKDAWRRLSRYLQQAEFPLETLVFWSTEGDRREFLSAFVDCGRKLDLSSWSAESVTPSHQFSGWSENLCGFTSTDIEHLLTLPVPTSVASVIVLSRKKIEKLRSELEPLVQKGWKIEDPDGQRLTVLAPMVGTAGPRDDASAGGTGAGPTLSPKGAGQDTLPTKNKKAGMPKASFESHQEKINGLISKGMWRALDMALNTWLGLGEMSESQLSELKKMAGEYLLDKNGDIKDAATRLLGAVDQSLAQLRTQAAQEPTPSRPQGHEGLGMSVVQSDTQSLVSAPVVADVKTDLFTLRKKTIESFVHEGLVQTLSKALSVSSWLDFSQMSREQLRDLQALADQHAGSEVGNVKAAAKVLDEALKKAKQGARV